MIIFDPAEHSPQKRQGMLSSLVTPRPIAMITTAAPNGTVNVAPFSYYWPLGGEPMLLGVTMGARRDDSSDPKDTYANAMRDGEFVVNVTTEALRDHIEMAAMEFPPGISEMEAIGWTTTPSHVVSVPSLAESPAHLECRVYRVFDVGDPDVVCSGVHLVLGEVVCVVLDEEVCSSSYNVDQRKLLTVGRMAFPYLLQTTPGSLHAQERVPHAVWASRRSADGRQE